MSSKISEPQEPQPARRPDERPGPVGGKRDRNRRQKTAQIVAAGLELFLERGIEAVTIDQLVARAGIAKGSFYRYFDNKAQLVEAVVEPLGLQVLSALDRCLQWTERAESPGDLVQGYQALAAQLAEAIMARPLEARLYLQECRAPAAGAARPVRELADGVSQRAYQLTRVASEHGLLAPRNSRVSALAVIGASERLVFAVLSHEPVGDIPGIGDALIAMILEGLAVR